MTSTHLGHPFTVARRGYDRDEVDARMAGLQRQVEALEGELADVRSSAADVRRAADGFRVRLVELEAESEALRAQLDRRPDPAVLEATQREQRDLEQAKAAAEARVDELERQVEELTARLHEAETAAPVAPSFETLGHEVASVLQSARDQAEGVLAAAEADRRSAAEALRVAHEEAEQAVAEAEARASRLAESAERQAERTIEDAHGKAVAIVAEARAEADRLTAEATRRVAALEAERTEVLSHLGRLVGGLDALVSA